MTPSTRRALAAARATRFMLVARELGLDVTKLGDVTGLFGDALVEEAEVTIDPRGTRASLAAPWPRDDEARARIASMLGDRIRILEQRGHARPVIEVVLDGTFVEIAAYSNGAAPLADDLARAAVELPAFARDDLRRLAAVLVDPARASECDGVQSTSSGLALRFRRTDDAATLASLLVVAGELGVTAAQRKLVENIHPIVGRNRTTVLALHAGETGLALEASWPDIAWENVVRITTGLYGKTTGARVGSLAGATGAPHASALHLLFGDREPPRALVAARIVAADSVQ